MISAISLMFCNISLWLKPRSPPGVQQIAELNRRRNTYRQPHRNSTVEVISTLLILPLRLPPAGVFGKGISRAGALEVYLKDTVDRTGTASARHCQTWTDASLMIDARRLRGIGIISSRAC